ERERGVVVFGTQDDLVGAPLAREHLLRERRAVVGQRLLCADEHESPVVAVLAERLDRAQARERCADHDDGARGSVLPRDEVDRDCHAAHDVTAWVPRKSRSSWWGRASSGWRRAGGCRAAGTRR